MIEKQLDLFKALKGDLTEASSIDGLRGTILALKVDGEISEKAIRIIFASLYHSHPEVVYLEYLNELKRYSSKASKDQCCKAIKEFCLEHPNKGRMGVIEYLDPEDRIKGPFKADLYNHLCDTYLNNQRCCPRSVQAWPDEPDPDTSEWDQWADKMEETYFQATCPKCYCWYWKKKE